MANYKDKLNSFFDDDAPDKGADETRVFDSQSFDAVSAGIEEIPELSKEKKSGFSIKDSMARLTQRSPKKRAARENKEKKGKKKTGESDFPLRFRNDRHTGIVGGILYFVFVVALSALLAGFGWLAATDVLALGKTEEAVEVTIPDEYDSDTIADILFDKGLIKYKSLFKFYGGLSKTPLEERVQPGTYRLYTNFDYRALVHGLTPAGAERIPVDVTIPEGYTMRQIFRLLEERGVCKATKLWDTAANYDFDYEFLDKSTLGNEKRLEGYMFPDTYEFYLSQDPESVIKKFLSNFNNRFDKKMRELAEEKGYSVSDIVIVASIVEKEAVGDIDRATIASVIFNRLNNEGFPYLQFDSTINYIINETGQEFSTEIDSPYNTYKYEGLPAGAISNPGMACINAALEPEDTGYYYYALGKDGVHHFFRSSDGFLDFVSSDEYAG
ncbi:MAG: endolytic transglycosylase MltG [Oscillospiraceae bacterium]|nr:endolytic transglycosylase MltG [Oscillospiraceae bacterium]